MSRSQTLLFVLITLCSYIACTPDVTESGTTDWHGYLGDDRSTQYSELSQLDTSNVSKLRLAWRYDGGEAHPDNRSQIQCNPLIIDGKLYGTTATLKLIALDASTGELLWEFDPFSGSFESYGMGVNRGLAMYKGPTGERILFYGAGDQLLAVNPHNGTLVDSFGNKGKLDLSISQKDDQKLWVLANTPGIIYQDLIIIGGRVSESTGAAPGHIRAFDVHTGAERWTFHTIPQPGEFGYETWPKDAYQTMGGANVWSGMSLDTSRGIVYCPTGSASYDFYGGDREGLNLFANCIIALNAKTGERLWHYQTIHHDLWDKDIPASPNLVTIHKNGQDIDAVAQITKNGLLFVLNRETGEPIYPITEKPVPESQLKGEKSWPTQPVPSFYPPFSRTELTQEDLATRSPSVEQYANGIWENTNHQAGMFEPTSEKGSIVFPGLDGGGEWGGAAYDPVEGDLVINSNEMPWRIIMDRVKPASIGERIYQTQCQNCHGQQFEGSELYGNIPPLTNLKNRVSLSEATHILTNGKGLMPSFAHLDQEEIRSVYNYLNGADHSEKTVSSDWPYPYIMRGYEKLNAPDGYPIITPPWGQLTSINLNNGKINWQIPLGIHKELMDQGVPPTGTENYGGPIVTVGGLVFIAATMDQKFRCFDKYSGKLLWEYDLPAAGYATPATYAVDGRQYVVIACGGGKLGTPSGDSYLAFAL